MNIDYLAKLDDSNLIAMAINRIDTPFSPEYYDRINIFRSEDWLYVSFNMSICYVPANSQYLYSVYVYLSQHMVSYHGLENPDDYEGDGNTFFIPGKESDEAIQQVVSALKKNGEIEFTEDGCLHPAESMIIKDNPDYFGIEVVSETWDYSCKINKNSSQVYDVVIGTLEPPLEE